MRLIFALLLIGFTFSCNKEEHQTLKVGTYQVAMDVQDNEQLMFNFEIMDDHTLNIFNAEEIIEVDQIRYVNDSVYINFPVYEGYLAAVFDGDNIKGEYIKESLDRYVPFKAIYGKAERFEVFEDPTIDMSGNWQMLFTEDDGSTFVAKGIFKQENNILTGTIRTTTGDYRYLEGTVNGTNAKFSAFDGAHAFLFSSQKKDSILQGAFYSGNHYKATFTAQRNENYELPNEDVLTFLNEGYEKFEFSFPDENGNFISNNDVRFKNKVTLVQIMGTWCPNCLDESRFYAEAYKTYKNQDLEIVALAFEYAKTEEFAFKGINRLRQKLNLEYPILLAQFGTSSKTEAQKKLPMLNHVLSYPTTIFIDKKGDVRKIHTGFNGPATGDKYEAFKKEFHTFVARLLNE